MGIKWQKVTANQQIKRQTNKQIENGNNRTMRIGGQKDNRDKRTCVRRPLG